jgi:uncharacterized protein DUF3800
MMAFLFGELARVTPCWHIEKPSRIAFSRSLQERLMFMFTAYFDESGTHHGSHVVVVAGYLSADEQWGRFCDEWQSVLDDYKIDYFHMTDFENRRKQFKNMLDSDRRRLLERLIAFIKIRQRIGFAVTFDLAVYNEMIQEFADLPLKQPYAFCALTLMGRIRAWLRKHSYDEYVAYVYESGAKHAGQVHSAYNYWMRQGELARIMRIGSMVFGDKRDVLPLQAADILAYETWKEVSNTIAGRPRQVRWPMKQLALSPLNGLRIERDTMRAIMLDLQRQWETGYLTLPDDGF